MSDVFVFNFQVPKYPNPRWPPDTILKINPILQNAMLTTFYAFSGMQNQIFIVFWQFSTQV